MIAAHLQDLQPLYSMEAEMSALGSMLLSQRAAEDVVGLIESDDFYNPAHRELFLAMKQLLISNKPIDLVTLENELRARDKFEGIGGETYLREIAEYVPSAANAGYYCEIVADRAMLRRLETAGRDIVHSAHDADGSTAREKVDKAEQLVFDAGAKRMSGETQTMRSLAKEFFVEVDNMIESGKALTGLATGFPDLDRMTGGFFPGDLILIGARPSMGKSSAGMDIALNAAQESVKEKDGAVVFFSLEMSAVKMARRAICALGGVSQYMLRSPNIGHEQYKKVANAAEICYSLPFHIDDSPRPSVLEMRGKCRRVKQQAGLKLVVVDHVGFMRGSRKTENRVQEISDISRGLKELALDLHVPVVALTQLNRAVEQRDDKRPQLSDLRDSGSLEQDADIVVLLYRDAYYKAKEHRDVETYDPDHVEEAEVIVAKNRDGNTGKVVLGFQASYARFRSLYGGGNG